METVTKTYLPKKSTAIIAFQLWFFAAFVLSVIFLISLLQTKEEYAGAITTVFFIAVFIGSLPAFIILLIAIPFINKSNGSWDKKIFLLFGFLFCISCLYAIVAGPVMYTLKVKFFISTSNSILAYFFMAEAALFISCLTAAVLIIKQIAVYFCYENKTQSFLSILIQLFNLNNQKIKVMEPSTNEIVTTATSQSNRILIKGVITGALILLLLIPAFFITNLVTERQQRQTEVVKEVSSKWATEQTISGPYLVFPYKYTYTNDTGKIITTKTNLVVFAEDLKVNGEMIPENRQRSIYKVLLYKSSIAVNGFFKPQWPADVNTANIDFTNAKLCFGLSDFKGLEEEIKIKFNKQPYVLSPGLPLDDISKTGLSVPVQLTAENLTAELPFNLSLKLRGSERLHFLPLAANCKFEIKSNWPHPSFDGNVLPNEHAISEKGFNASWAFNRANLPFNMVAMQGKFKSDKLDFGVSIVQPADQYEKTMRSVKYAVLFIGLTFAFFFIIELLQKKPFHPVQYVLVGLALLIFYTLLLSISEFILFDYAYGMAAFATIALISLYAKSHFAKWGIAGIFAAALSCLYGFIFVLIRLEDTALLLGSIGLFIVLAVVMYLSRRIKWYGTNYQTA